MTIEVKDLLDQAVTLAAERRQKVLSEEDTKQVLGGKTSSVVVIRPVIPPVIIGIPVPNDGPFASCSISKRH